MLKGRVSFFRKFPPFPRKSLLLKNWLGEGEFPARCLRREAMKEESPLLFSVGEHFPKRRPSMPGLHLGRIPGSVAKLTRKHPSSVHSGGQREHVGPGWGDCAGDLRDGSLKMKPLQAE
jgi:hypothetical protein